MKEEWKQTLIDTVLANRGVVTDAYGADNYTSQQLQQLGAGARTSEELQNNLDSLIGKDISDRQFIAQLITTLEVFDAKIGITTDNSLDMFYASNAKIVENSMQALEPLVEGDNTFANQYNSYSFSGPRYVYTLPVDFVQEVQQGIDMATGVSPYDQSESIVYRNFLKEEVDKFIEDTGKVAIIAKPGGGSGFLFYTSPAIQENFEKNGTDDIRLRFTLPSLKTFGGNDADLLYYPVMEKPADANNYVPSGEYVSLKENALEDGTATDADTGQGTYMTFTQNPITGAFENFKLEELTSEEYNKALEDPLINLQQISGSTESEKQENYEDLKSTLTGLVEDNSLSVFGDLPADHFIFKNVEQEFQEPTAEGFVQDAKEQFTVSDYGIENLYGGFDHISGSPAEGKISWISLPPDEQEAIQLQLMQAGFLSPDLYYAEAGEWGVGTRSAMKSAMIEANYKLEKIGPFLQNAVENFMNRPTIYPIVYPQASPLAVKNAVQSALESVGARTDLSTGEMAAFMDFYRSSEQDYQKAAIDYNRNLELINRGIMPDNKLVAPDSAVDRTADYIEQQMQPEIQSQLRGAEQARNVSYLTYSVDRMRDIIG